MGKWFTTWAEELAERPGLRLAEDGAAWPGYGAFVVPVPDTDEGLWAGGCTRAGGGAGEGGAAGRWMGAGQGDSHGGNAMGR